MDFLRDEALQPVPGELVVTEARLGRTFLALVFLAVAIGWCLSPLLHPLAGSAQSCSACRAWACRS
jgi:hypothetical protein